MQFDEAPNLFDVSAQRVVAKFKHPKTVRSLDFSSDGRRIITACDDDSVRLWSADDGKELVQNVGYKQVSRVAFSPDGRYAGISSYGSNLWVFSADLATNICTLSCGIPVREFAFSADGELLAVLGLTNGVIEVWKVSSGEYLARHQHEGDCDRLRLLRTPVL
jgi:WD40 repeat protein